MEANTVYRPCEAALAWQLARKEALRRATMGSACLEAGVGVVHGRQPLRLRAPGEGKPVLHGHLNAQQHLVAQHRAQEVCTGMRWGAARQHSARCTQRCCDVLKKNKDSPTNKKTSIFYYVC